MAPEQTPEDEPDPEQIEALQVAAFDRLSDYEAKLGEKAVRRLYGELPSWFPEPARRRIDWALGVLRNARQSSPRIASLVASARKDEYRFPAAARDTLAVLESVSYLAHVQWALGLGKGRALEELGGKFAAIGERTSAQRRQYSELGNESKKRAATENERIWLAIGQPLRQQYPDRSDLWLAKQIARLSDGNASTIRAALSRLNLKKSC